MKRSFNESLQATRPSDDDLPFRDVPSFAISINSGVRPGRLSFGR